MKGMKKPKRPSLAKASRILGAALLGGATRGMTSPPVKGAEAPEPDSHADIERQGVGELEAAARAFKHGAAYAQNLHYTKSAAQVRREGGYVPSPEELLSSPPATSDIEDNRYSNEFEE